MHLITTLKKWYKLSEDWEVSLYCGVSLKWNYDVKDKWLDISIPGYLDKMIV